MKKQGLYIGLTLLAACIVSVHAGVRVGDSYERVLEVLGEPVGLMESESLMLLYFDRGTVRLEDGQVTRLNLMSEQAAQERLARIQAEAETARRLAEEQRERRIREGLALKQQQLTDPSYDRLHPGDQVRFWEGFMRRYPEVPVHNEFRTAQRAYQENAVRERELAEREHRLRDMEQRLHEAEARAMRAERNRYYAAPYYVQPVYYPTFYQHHPSHDSRRSIYSHSTPGVSATVRYQSSPRSNGSRTDVLFGTPRTHAWESNERRISTHSSGTQYHFPARLIGSGGW